MEFEAGIGGSLFFIYVYELQDTDRWRWSVSNEEGLVIAESRRDYDGNAVEEED